MKLFFILFIALIGASLFYKYIVQDDVPPALKQAIAKQPNPFTVPKDSNAIVWSRALQLLEGRKSLLAGGELVQTDSTIFLPYYNDYHKGNSILIERKPLGNSVVFKVSWWYSGSLQQSGSKEIALFMKKGVSRYGNHF